MTNLFKVNIGDSASAVDDTDEFIEVRESRGKFYVQEIERGDDNRIQNKRTLGRGRRDGEKAIERARSRVDSAIDGINTVAFERQIPTGKFAPEGTRPDESVPPDRGPEGRFVSGQRKPVDSIGRREIDGLFSQFDRPPEAPFRDEGAEVPSPRPAGTDALEARMGPNVANDRQTLVDEAQARDVPLNPGDERRDSAVADGPGGVALSRDSGFRETDRPEQEQRPPEPALLDQSKRLKRQRREDAAESAGVLDAGAQRGEMAADGGQTADPFDLSSGALASTNESREIEFGGEQIDLTQQDTDDLEQMNDFLTRNLEAEIDAERAKGGFGTSDMAQDFSARQVEVQTELDRRR